MASSGHKTPEDREPAGSQQAESPQAAIGVPEAAPESASELSKSQRPASTSPDLPAGKPEEVSTPPSSPSIPSPYDWDDFERRYEEALREADVHERDVLKEAEDLSTYFRAWTCAASVHDDERAVKRLQTRKRFVNLSEEKMAQKQQHYEEVVRAFESALALLRTS